MVLAGIFAVVLCLGLILGDWLYFTRLTPDASRYGCGVARSREHFPPNRLACLQKRFDGNGALALPHGIARYYPDLNQIAIRPQYRPFSLSFRTAWPVKGLIHLSSHGTGHSALCIKRIPWSSAILTLVWFLLVGFGTIAFFIAYARQGGFGSLSGMLMGAGILGVGFLVLAFGIVTVVLSYRLENTRLETVYGELRAAAEAVEATT